MLTPKILVLSVIITKHILQFQLRKAYLQSFLCFSLHEIKASFGVLAEYLNKVESFNSWRQKFALLRKALAINHEDIMFREAGYVPEVSGPVSYWEINLTEVNAMVRLTSTTAHIDHQGPKKEGRYWNAMEKYILPFLCLSQGYFFCMICLAMWQGEPCGLLWQR